MLVKISFVHKSAFDAAFGKAQYPQKWGRGSSSTNYSLSFLKDITRVSVDVQKELDAVTSKFRSPSINIVWITIQKDCSCVLRSTLRNCFFKKQRWQIILSNSIREQKLPWHADTVQVFL